MVGPVSITINTLVKHMDPEQRARAAEELRAVLDVDPGNRSVYLAVANTLERVSREEQAA